VSLNEMFEALSGRRIPGGCDDCDAYQTMTQRDGIYAIEVSHDETCPFSQKRAARRAARRRKGGGA